MVVSRGKENGKVWGLWLGVVVGEGVIRTGFCDLTCSDDNGDGDDDNHDDGNDDDDHQ